MNFDFSQDQKLLQKSAQGFLKDHASLAGVRKILDTDADWDATLWTRMAEQGWQGTAIPEEFGGAGLGYLELALLSEELGASLAPVPFSSSVYFVTEAVLHFGTDEQKRKYLPKLATGETIGALAWAEGLGMPGVSGPLKTCFDGNSLSGTKLPVLDGQVANLAVVVTSENDALSLVLVDLNSDGVQRSRLDSMDPTRSQSSISFNGAPGERLGSSGDGSRILDLLLDRAAVLVAFEQLGGANRAHKMSLEYAKERYAFGRQIGSFQAIKHKIVDMLMSVDLARSNCLYAAWALQNNTDLPVAAAAARVAATEAFEFCSKENIQVHGGIGFTWEADAHLFFKRSKLLTLWLGNADLWRDRLMAKLDDKHAA